MAAVDLSTQIATTAQGPASASSDAGSRSAMPIDAQIQADRYLAAKAAARLRGRGLMFTRLYGPNQVNGVAPQGTCPPGMF